MARQILDLKAPSSLGSVFLECSRYNYTENLTLNQSVTEAVVERPLILGFSRLLRMESGGLGANEGDLCILV